MRFCFDLDGTLLDTKQAVIEAYRAAGVEMPPDAWGKPWQSWLKFRHIHEWKNEHYPAMLRQHVKLLPLWPYAIAGHEIITGASEAAVRVIERYFIVKLNVKRFSATAQDKIDYLLTIPPGVYVDDDAETRRLTEEQTKWRAISPEEFLRSFSRPAPTLG